MKILHVWSTAGIGAILAAGLRDYGHDAKCIMRMSHDPFGISSFYQADCRDIGGAEFIALSRLESTKYDIIHCHGGVDILRYCRAANPDARIVQHHHGTRLIKATPAERKIFTELSDMELVCAEYLLEFAPNAKYLPHPIDTDHFFDYSDGITHYPSPVVIVPRYGIQENVKKHIQRLGIGKVEYVKRNLKPVPYRYMPNYLNKIKTYIDIRSYSHDPDPRPHLGTTGLQALACGAEVITADGERHTEFPKMHEMHTVTRKLIEMYKEL